MLSRFKSSFVFSAVLGLSLNSMAQSSNDENAWKALANVRKNFLSIPLWQGEILQEHESKALGSKKISHGKIIFGSPNRFSYKLSDGEKSEFISNGTEAWLSVLPEKKEEKPKVVHFSKPGDIELIRAFLFLTELDFSTPEEKELLSKSLRLTSFEDASGLSLEFKFLDAQSLARIHYHFEKSAKIPFKIIVEDSLGDSTTVRIQKIKELSKAPLKAFTVQIPSGAKIEEATQK